jgi:hypothetical protein
MSTQPASKAAPKAAEAPKAVEEAKPKKEKKAKLPKQVVRLQDNAKNTLRFTAKQHADGSAVSFATHSVRDPEGKPTRAKGASAKHASFDEAVKAISAGAEAAKKLGWLAKGRASGGSSKKSDSFSLESLPAPKQ